MLCESKGNLESSFELTYQTKKQLTLIGLTLRRFAAGIDYMIIIPSLWFYLESFNSRYYFLGLVIAADSLVCFFLSPWVQKLAEKTHKVRLLGFFANLAQIGGSMIYALPLYFYMPLVGRLVSGIGESFGGALYHQIRRVTTPEERSRTMIIMEGVRLFGIVIGPGMNFFLQNFDLRFGPWIIDRRTAPGFFMAIVWLLVEVVHVFTVFDLDDVPQGYKELPSDVDDEQPAHDDEQPTVHDDEQPTVHDDEQPTVHDEQPAHDEKPTYEEQPAHDEQPRGPIDETDEHEAKVSFDESLEATSDEDSESEKIEMFDDGNKNIEEPMKFHEDEEARVIPTYSDGARGSDHRIPKRDISGAKSFRELLGRHDVMIILVGQFMMFFNQTAFETLLLLIGTDKLSFTINILSIVFIVAGAVMVVVIIAVWSANKTIDAKYLLLTSLSAGILASFARLATTFTDSHTYGCLAMTLLMGFFTVISTPIASIAGKSLLPKITRVETHGFYQGAFATAQHLGLVTGSLVASVMYNYLWIFSALTIVIFIVVYMLMLSVVDKLNIVAQGCGM